MNKVRWIKVLGVPLILLVASVHVMGQNVQCTQRLAQAQRLYDQGRLTEVEAMLVGENKDDVNCLKNGLSKEQQTTAYRLLALVHIFLDDEPNAEDAIIDLLLVDPEHPAPDTDPAEFRALYNKFRSQPIFRWGVFFGLSQTSANPLSEYEAFDRHIDESGNGPTHFTDLDGIGSPPLKKTFEPGLGFTLGASIEYMPVKNLELVLRTQMNWQNYKVSFPVISDTPDLEASNFRVEGLTEAMQWIKVPLSARYNFPLAKKGEKAKVTPYVTGGISLDYLLASKIGEGNREGTTSVSVTFGEDLIKNDLRDRVNWTSFAGVGVKLSVKRINSLFFEATYGVGGKNIVNGANRYISQDQNWNVAHIDGDKSIDVISINAGFIMSVYKPKKFSDKKLARMAKRNRR